MAGLIAVEVVVVTIGIRLGVLISKRRIALVSVLVVAVVVAVKVVVELVG